MTRVPRIYYLCPDNPQPSGGVRRLYRHVEILSRHGFRAFIVHSHRAFRINWFDHSISTIGRDDLRDITPDDVMVIPEVLGSVMCNTPRLKTQRVAIALNWSLIFKYLPLGHSWLTCGITNAIAGSECEADFILKTMGITAPVLPSGVDNRLFYNEDPSILRIAYMPRKNSEAPLILRIFRSMFPEHLDVPIISLDGVDHNTVAGIMRSSTIFLTATYPEGMARPPLEAMASGCIVVGFSGRGSLQYMRHASNCYVAPDGDVLEAARLLGKAVDAVKAGTSLAMQSAALRTAAEYSLSNEETNVIGYWTDRLASAAAPQKTKFLWR